MVYCSMANPMPLKISSTARLHLLSDARHVVSTEPHSEIEQNAGDKAKRRQLSCVYRCSVYR